MQTNALSRQVALLAEPKNPLDSTMSTSSERCKTEGVVDVFQVVKALRVQKPGAVPTVVS